MKIKFAEEEDNHAPRSLWHASNAAGLLPVVHQSSPLYLLHLSLGWSTTTHEFDKWHFLLFSTKGIHLKSEQKQWGIAGSSDWPEFTSRLIVSSVYLRQGSKVKKQARHQLHPATSLSPSQDTEGSEINLAAAPKIEHGPPLEQDAGCVGTSRGHCGQQSYFCSATGPPGVDAHSFIRLPASREGDTHGDTKKCVHTYKPCQWTIGMCGTCSIRWDLVWWRPICQSFFVTWGYLCLFLCIWVYLYESRPLVFELKDGGNTPGGSEWPHVSDTLSLCLSLFPSLAEQHIIAIGSRLQFISAAFTRLI